MFNIPESCFYNKKIPKDALYNNIDIKSDIKKIIVDEIDCLIWTHKISSDTINIKKGSKVQEIEIFLVRLKKDELNDDVLKIIDKNIPYHTVFCLMRNENEYKLKINFKTKLSNKENLDMSKYYETDWMSKEPNILINGIDIDNVYYEIFKNISKINILDNTNDKQDNILETIKNNEEIEKLEKEVDRLRKKRAKTIDDKDKQQINVDIKKILNKIDELKN